MSSLSPAIAVLDGALVRLGDKVKENAGSTDLTVVIAVGAMSALIHPTDHITALDETAAMQQRLAGAPYLAFLMALYPGAAIERVVSLEAVGAALARHPAMDRLVISCHGASADGEQIDAVVYARPGDLPTKLVALPATWGKAHPLPVIRKRIELVACSVARAPWSIFDFGHAMKAPAVWAPNCSTALGTIPFTDEKQAEMWARAGRDYCLGFVDPGTIDEDLRGSVIAIGALHGQKGIDPVESQQFETLRNELVRMAGSHGVSEKVLRQVFRKNTTKLVKLGAKPMVASETAFYAEAPDKRSQYWKENFSAPGRIAFALDRAWDPR